MEADIHRPGQSPPTHIPLRHHHFHGDHPLQKSTNGPSFLVEAFLRASLRNVSPAFLQEWPVSNKPSGTQMNMCEYEEP